MHGSSPANEPIGPPPLRVEKPSLIRYCFAHTDALDGNSRAAADHLRGIWHAWDQLGATNPMSGSDVGTKFPPWPRPTGKALAQLLAAKASDDHVMSEAFIFVRHDVVALIAGRELGSDSCDAMTWRHRHDTWLAESDELGTGMLGDAIVSMGLWPAGPPDWGRIDAAVGSGGPRFRTADSIGVWETPTRDEQRRAFTAIAPGDREAELEDFLWYRVGDLPRFARYLLHAAKARYEFEVFRRDIPRLRQLRTDLAPDLALDRGGVVTHEDLLKAQIALRSEQDRWFDLLTSITRLGELRRTALIAARNIEALIPELAADGPPPADSPFRADVELAEWTASQAEHELASSQGIDELTSKNHALRRLDLEEAADEHARDQNDLTLLQATLIAAPLTGLTVIQAVNGHVEVDSALQAPIVVLAAAVAGTLPALIVHISRRHALWDAIAAGVLAAAITWLAITLVWRDPGMGAIVAAVTGLAVGGALAERWKVLRPPSSG